MKKMTREGTYTLLILVLLVCFYAYSVSRIYGFEMFPDEFGYWTYAAALSGYDWSDVISLGSYYSFGYTLILYPIFQIFTDSVIAYRAAVTVNFVLLAASFLAIAWLLHRISPKGSKYASYIPFISAIAIFYPSWLYYARMTMTEVLVMSMYIFICLLMYIYLDKNKLWALALLILSLAYIYTVHMRTVGILIAAAMILGVNAVCKAIQMIRKKSGHTKDKAIHIARAVCLTAILLLLGAALLITASKVKGYITTQIYTADGVGNLSTNDYSGQVGRLKSLLTLSGIKSLFISVLGKLLYLGLASFGLVYWGAGFCIGKIRKGQNRLFFAFVLLATAGEVGITSIYTMGTGGRVDSLTYGRYNEQIVPILMAFGCMAVMEAKSVKGRVSLIALLHLPVTVMVIYIIKKYEMASIEPGMVPGICYLYTKSTFEPTKFYIEAYLIGTVLMILVMLVLRMGSRTKTQLLLMAVVAIELFFGVRLEQNISHARQMANFRDVQLIDIIQEERENHERLVYLQEGDNSMVDNLQFRLRDEKIILETDEEMLAEDDLVVTAYNYSRLDDLKETYANWRIMGHLAIFFN